MMQYFVLIVLFIAASDPVAESKRMSENAFSGEQPAIESADSFSLQINPTPLPKVTDKSAEELWRLEDNKCLGYDTQSKRCRYKDEEIYSTLDMQMCEKHPMARDGRSSKCHVSELWMLSGVKVHVMWWAQIQKNILEAKMSKFEKNCMGEKFFKFDWVNGKCKRRMQHVVRAMNMLPKLTKKLPKLFDDGTINKNDTERILSEYKIAVQNVGPKFMNWLRNKSGSKEFSDLLLRAETLLTTPSNLVNTLFVDMIKAFLTKDLRKAAELIEKMEHEKKDDQDLDTAAVQAAAAAVQATLEEGMDAALTDVTEAMRKSVDSLLEIPMGGAPGYGDPGIFGGLVSFCVIGGIFAAIVYGVYEWGCFTGAWC